MSVKKWWVGALAFVTAAVISLTGCSSITKRGADVPWVTLERSASSPSGDFVASLETKHSDDGNTWIVPIIKDASGVAVYTDPGYARRHSLLVMWEANRDVLWVVSSDVGSARIEVIDGVWTKTWDKNIPPEIQEHR